MDTLRPYLVIMIFQPTTIPLTVARAVQTIILYSPDRHADRHRRRRPTEFSLYWRDRIAVLILPFIYCIYICVYTLNTENKQIKYYQ